MKKLNNKGFTLIELLAVITIMGILMLVAIPSISRTIENARRDTFAETAGKYLHAVRNSYIADELECQNENGAWAVASATPNGTYYFPICTNKSATGCFGIARVGGIYAGNELSNDTIQANTLDLMETGGKSSFGNADVVGYVKWEKSQDDKVHDKVTYSVYLIDTGYHGFGEEQQQAGLKRSNVSTQDPPTVVTAKNIPKVESGETAYACKLA